MCIRDRDIFGSGFDFDLDIRLGAGAFVCGEETALMTSIEGKRGEPRPRPPFPAEKGLFGKPSVLNNVETYANIPQIILNGPEWFRSMGTEKSKGTKEMCIRDRSACSASITCWMVTPEGMSQPPEAFLRMVVVPLADLARQRSAK